MTRAQDTLREIGADVGRSQPVYHGHTSPIIAAGEWMEGHVIRRAAKATRCDYWRGKINGGRCDAPIRVGDLYLEGEHNETAGGFGFDKYCAGCAQIAPAAEPATVRSVAQDFVRGRLTASCEAEGLIPAGVAADKVIADLAERRGETMPALPRLRGWSWVLVMALWIAAMGERSWLTAGVLFAWIVADLVADLRGNRTESAR